MVDPAPQASSIQPAAPARSEQPDSDARVQRQSQPAHKKDAGGCSGVHGPGAISRAATAAAAAAVAADFAPAGNSPANDASQLVAILIAKNSTGADLLRGLSQLVGSMESGDPRRSFYEQEFSVHLRGALAGLAPGQRSRAAARLASPAVAALRHTLREGVGQIDLRARAAAVRTVSEVGRQLAMLQKFFGVEAGAGAPAPGDFEQARRTVDDFARQFDSGCVRKSGEFGPEQIMQMQLGYRPFDNDELARDPASLLHPQASRDFIQEAPHNCYLLEHEDGRCEWLVAPHLDGVLADDQQAKLAADRLLLFCGGDRQACLAVSQAATGRAAQVADLDLAMLAGELPHVAADGRDEAPTPVDGRPPIDKHKALTGFVIKKTGAGNYQVLARSSEQLVGQNGRSGPTALNPNQSHWNTEVTVAVGPDRRPQFESASYEFVAALHLGRVDSGQQPRPADFDERAAAAELLAQQERISVYGDFSALPVDPDQVRANSGSSPAELAGQLVADGTLAADAAETVLERLRFVDDVGEQINAVDSGSEEGIERLTELAGNLASDLRLLQQDLLLKAQAWSVDLDADQSVRLNTFLVRVANALGGEAARIEDLAADRAAALDDGRGDLNEVVSGSLLARSENAFRQARAGILATTRIIDAISEAQEDLSPAEEQALDDLIEQLDRRAGSRQADLAAVRSGRGDPEQASAAGAGNQDLARQARRLKSSLAAGRPLPAVHAQLSEAQLFRLQIDELGRRHPGLAGHFADFDARYAEAAADLLAQGGWATIRSSFHDIDGQGRLQKLTSTITPAPQLDEPNLQDRYGGLGVASGNRTQGRHAANLAHSQIANEDGEVVFAGLRHGIVDSYRIVPDQLARMPEAKLRQLIADTLLDDDQWRQFVSDRRGGSTGRARLLDQSADLIRSGDAEAVRLAAGRARQAANRNAARELATAAIIANPALRSRALAAGEITVDLDSVSLVTPDVLRERGGREEERTYLANQIEALNSLAGQPFTVRIGNEYRSREVQVTVRPRMFNFGVNAYAIGSGRGSSLLKGFMGWEQADRMNRESLAALIGDPDRTDEVGGEAGRLLAWLEGSSHPEEVPDAIKVTVSPNAHLAGNSERQRTAFDDHARRAEAIRRVAGQIKEIFSSRSHRRGGNEPYKLASRVALLSNLLGRSTCYNCKSGKDRTGHLDAAAKLLAVDAAAGRHPAPDAPPDQRRSTNFVLKTGNLEMQQHNTGLRGYKLSFVPALFSQLISPLARRMFSGDSKLAKS